MPTVLITPSRPTLADKLIFDSESSLNYRQMNRKSKRLILGSKSLMKNSPKVKNRKIGHLNTNKTKYPQSTCKRAHKDEYNKAQSQDSNT